MRTFVFAAVACVLAGCATPQPQNTTVVAAAPSKLTCDTSMPATGSHMIDRHSCDRKNVEMVGGDAVDTAMREHPSGMSSH